MIYIVNEQYVTSFGVPKTNKLHIDEHLKKVIYQNIAIFIQNLCKLLFSNVNSFVFLWSFEPHKPSTKAYEQHISENLIYSWPSIANSKKFAV